MENLFSLYPLAKLLLSGSNEGSVVFLLNGDGTKVTMGQKDGEANFATTLQLLASGKLSILDGSNLSTIYSLLGAGSRTFAGASTLRSELDLLSSGGRGIKGSSLFTNTYSLQSKPSITFSGSSTFTNTYTTISIPLLNIAGKNTGSIVLLLNGDGTKTTAGQQPGESSLSTVLNLLASGMLSIKSGTSLSVQSTLSGAPSLRFAGGMGPSLIITLTGDGNTAAIEDGSALLSTIIQLLGSGTLTIGASSSLSNIYSVLPASRLGISGGTQLDHRFGLDPSGKLTIAGGMGPSIIFGLSGDGGTAALKYGDSLLSIAHLLSSTGSLIRGGNATLLNQYGLSGTGKQTLGGLSTLSNIYSLDSRLTGVLSGSSTQSLILDLIGTLSTDSDSIVSLLFILNILQSKNFTLRIDKNKLFSLKI
jgi:hypothetical protein